VRLYLRVRTVAALCSFPGYIIVYANSLLATLNTRKSLHGKGLDNEESQGVTKSVPLTHSDFQGAGQQQVMKRAFPYEMCTSSR
jgi:hypothetical protein